MKIIKESLFKNPKNRSPDRRNKILYFGKKAKFKTFGKTYFDGGERHLGYGEYKYDSRYFKPVKKLVKSLKLEKKDRIIELGCAKGFILYEFWRLGFRNILGQDISRYAKNNSKMAIKKLLVTKCISKIHEKNNSVKFLFCKEVLPHLTINKLKKVFSEINRIIRKDGIIYLEIQTGRTMDSLKKMRQWDPSHKIIKTTFWWEKTINKYFTRSNNVIVNFKYLF